jgi:hypothetical protein
MRSKAWDHAWQWMRTSCQASRAPRDLWPPCRFAPPPAAGQGKRSVTGPDGPQDAPKTPPRLWEAGVKVRLSQDFVPEFRSAPGRLKEANSRQPAPPKFHSARTEAALSLIQRSLRQRASRRMRPGIGTGGLMVRDGAEAPPHHEELLTQENQPLRAAQRCGLAPTPASILTWTLIGDSHAGGESIGLSRRDRARHSFDGSCGDAVRTDHVQSRPRAGQRQWTGGVRGRRRAGRRICAGVALGGRFACTRRGSGRCGLRR